MGKEESIFFLRLLHSYTLNKNKRPKLTANTEVSGHVPTERGKGHQVIHTILPVRVQNTGTQISSSCTHIK